MTSYIAIAAFILGGLALARWMQMRDSKRIRPVLERVAKLRNDEVIRQSVLGLPQLPRVVGGVPVRLTPMSKSIASNEAGRMTSVDFDAGKFGVAEFRIQEAMAYLRNAVPPALQVIIGLPADADIHVQKGRACIMVSGVPTEIDFVLRLLAVAVRLIEVLLGLAPVSDARLKRQAAQMRFPSKAP